MKGESGFMRAIVFVLKRFKKKKVEAIPMGNCPAGNPYRPVTIC